MSAFNLRIQLVRDLMKEKSLEALVLRRNPNLAWAIAGRAHVPTTIDAACFDLIITQDSVTAITNVVEAPRLIAEEFPRSFRTNRTLVTRSRSVITSRVKSWR
jgi:antitoxin VapB